MKCSFIIFMKYPNLECIHVVIKVGSTDLNESFGLLRAFGSKLSLYTKTVLGTQR